MKNYFFIVFYLLFSCSKEDFNTIESQSPQTNVDLKNEINSRLVIQNNNLLPLFINENVKFGFNGHPFTQPPYINTIDQQIIDLKQHGCNFYRIEAASKDAVNLNDLNKFYQNNIEILPVLIFDPDFTKTNIESYILGKSFGIEMFNKFGANMKYYELGNELDILCINPGGDGFLREDYDLIKIEKLSSFYRGLIYSLKTLNSNCKLVISNGGWMHYLYFQLLLEQGVNFDIVGCHWYSNMGLLTKPSYNYNINVLEKLKEFEKPIWITEFNYTDVNNVVANSQVKAKYILDFLNDLKNEPSIDAIFAYQLYNQDYLDYTEGNYGFFDDAFINKLSSDSYKYKIEEIKFGFEDYIKNLYLKLFNTNANTQSGAFTNSVSELKLTKNKDLTLNNFFTSSSYYKNFIDQTYVSILDRQSDQSGRNYNMNLMLTYGFSREDILIEFCKGQEFWDKSGQTIPGFINNLYKKILKRNTICSDAERNYWINEYNYHQSKAYIIDKFIHSEEYYEKFVESQYINILGRPSDYDGKTYWINQMKSGVSQKDIIKEFLKSEGFLINSIRDGYLNRIPNGYFNNFEQISNL